MDDLKALRSFIEVVRNGSMADAALSCRISGAAISQQMARLEKEMGVRLLERHRFGVTPTPAGLVLAQRAQELLGSASDLRRSVIETADPSRSAVSLLAFASASVHILPTAIREFRRTFPDVHLSITEISDNYQPFSQLITGETDLAIVHEYDHVPLAVPEGIVTQTLGRDEFAVALQRDHPLSDQRSVSLSQLCDEDWVLFPHPNMGTESISRACADVGYAPKLTFEAADYQVVVALVAAGLGVSLMSQMVTKSLTKSHAIRKLKGDRVGRTIFLAWREESASVTIRRMSAAITSSFRQHMASPVASKAT